LPSGPAQPQTLLFREGFEAGDGDLGEVSEQILAAVIRGNEAKPFESLNHLTVPVAISTS
jgi:hypothetical protein